MRMRSSLTLALPMLRLTLQSRARIYAGMVLMKHCGAYPGSLYSTLISQNAGKYIAVVYNYYEERASWFSSKRLKLVKSLDIQPILYEILIGRSFLR